MWFVFEGLDGVGKSTLLAAVERRLIAAGLTVHCLSTPSPAFNLVRESLENIDRFEMLLGFYIGSAGGTANLAQHILKISFADVVLIDRYIYSTLALAYGRCVDLEPITKAFEADGLRPTGGFLVVCEEPVRRLRLLKRGLTRELRQLDEQEVLARMLQAYGTFPIRILHNHNERLDESAAEAVKVILNHSDHQ